VLSSSSQQTGGNSTTIYLGYGPQSTRLVVSATGGSSYTYSWTPTAHLSCTTCANPLFTPTAGGNYTFTVTVRNNYGCTSTCSITICVLDIRVASHGCGASSDKVYLCHYPPGNHNNPQTLSISINAVPAHLGNHSGDHLGTCSQVCGSAKDDEADDAAEIITDEDNTGFEMMVFPNPFQDQFHLRVQSTSTDQINLRMFDVTGQLITERNGISNDEEILLGDGLARGIYLVEVQQGETRKVIRMTKAN
jgi:hypothetical protein